VATNSTQFIGTAVPITAVAVNPVTNKAYVGADDAGGPVSFIVVDGTTDAITTLPSARVASRAAVVNPVTNKIYVADDDGEHYGDGRADEAGVWIIDGATNDLTFVPVGPVGHSAVAVNPATNKIYASTHTQNSVTVIDGATNNTSTVPVGNVPLAIAVNEVTNKIYVANAGSASVTVIDGATNATTTVPVGTNPVAVAVNPVTNKIYVANEESEFITVIDGASNSTTSIATPGVPFALAVNSVTNKIYFAKNSCGSTCSASATTFGVVDGTSRTISTSNTYAASFALNPALNNLYLLSYNGLSMLTEQQVQASPLATTITALPNNTSATATPTFTFTASSSFSPDATVPENVLFQVDTWQGPWTSAQNNGSGAFTGTTAPLLPGFHILYAYATDGQEATGSPLIGTIQAYGFLVAPQM
jgi:YVTN family beta-propeller protein